MFLSVLRSWNRLQPELELIFEVSAPGQTKIVYLIIIHLEEVQASDLNRHSFQKVMKTLHFDLKAV
jgi:hypothetical protein